MGLAVVVPTDIARDVCDRPHSLTEHWELDCLNAALWLLATILLVFVPVKVLG